MSVEISVVIPVYNSREMLEELVGRIKASMQALGKQFEILLVNDGSRDASWDEITRLVAIHPEIRAVDLMRNYGQHNALLCGIRSARGGLIVTLDDDLQNPPEEIGSLLAKLDEGFDVVYGKPEREQHGFLRDMASVITKIALQSAMGAQTARSVSPFRVFRTDLRAAFERYASPFVSVDVLLTWATTRFGVIKVRYDQRKSGSSNYTVFKLISHALNMMTGFSTVPLQVASWIGFALTLFGAAVLVFVVGRFLLQGSVPGFPFLASIIAIFSGAQLFALGIIGEYLARMHFRIMDRPTYAIRSTTEAK